MQITESRVQAKLQKEQWWNIIMPNTYLYDWESDLLSITLKGFVTEYEIKLSLSDFKVDLSKPKHQIFLGLLNMEPPNCPNKFYYVIPKDLVSLIAPLVPKYAGLIAFEVRYIEGEPEPWRFVVCKNATTLHNERVSFEKLLKAMQSLSIRYWRHKKV